MKKSFILFILLAIWGQSVAQSEGLMCSRRDRFLPKIEEKIDCTKDKYLELVAKDVFDIEIIAFDDETIKAIMLDDVSNPNWLSKKGVYDLRKNRLCLENICDIVWNKCNAGANQQLHQRQRRWCLETIDNIFEIQKVKVKTAVVENQRRKTRSAVREKFRAIEVRASRYFIPNLISFAVEFQIFTEKVTAFIFNPL